MKKITWIIIAAVIVIGGYTYYSNEQAKEVARIEAEEAKVAAATEVAAAAKAAEETAAEEAAAVEAAAAKAAEEAAAVAEALAAAEAADAAVLAALPFGSAADVGFAQKIWAAMLDQNLAGPDMLRAVPYEGTDPHGMMLELFVTRAVIDGHRGDLLVKRNFGPVGVSADAVLADPEKHLGAVTVMFRREAGFDEDNKNWFWVKFLPDGSLDKNPMGASLAGRVAKGMDAGCIACHAGADGDDYVFAPGVYE